MGWKEMADLDFINYNVKSVAMWMSTEEYNLDTPGSSFLFAYGISDDLSLSLSVDLPEAVIRGLQGDGWRMVLTPLVRYQIVNSQTYKIHAWAQAQVLPLFHTSYSGRVDNGFWNGLVGVSGNWRLHQQESFSLYTYGETKILVSGLALYQPHPQFRWENTNIGNGVIELDKSNTSFDYGLTWQNVFSTGLDFTWGNFIWHLGIHFPVWRYMVSEKYQFTDWFIGLDGHAPHQLLDIGWRWRFGTVD